MKIKSISILLSSILLLMTLSTLTFSAEMTATGETDSAGNPVYQFTDKATGKAITTGVFSNILNFVTSISQGDVKYGVIIASVIASIFAAFKGFAAALVGLTPAAAAVFGDDIAMGLAGATPDVLFDDKSYSLLNNLSQFLSWFFY